MHYPLPPFLPRMPNTWWKLRESGRPLGVSRFVGKESLEYRLRLARFACAVADKEAPRIGESIEHS